MKVCIAVFILCVAVFSEGRIHDELRKRRQISDTDLLDVFGIPANGNQRPGGQQFGQGGNQFGQGGNQFGQGGDPFGQGGNQFGQGGNQFGQGGNQFGQGGDPFGQGGNQFGQGGNQFGQGGNQQGGNPQGGNQQGGNVPVDQNPTTTTQSPRVRNCITNCQTTTQYNPVCGSNGVQYQNIERLNCARRCGVNVTPLSRGSNC